MGKRQPFVVAGWEGRLGAISCIQLDLDAHGQMQSSRHKAFGSRRMRNDL